MDAHRRSPEDTTIDNERCGICTDIVIDRGVLDCCDHWFCFVCIDNWATITNLCPLCKSEFQLITCLPVYNTIGNIKTEDFSLSRDDDWCIQGENNTLSFPSYYIDEDAVICLDGDRCKIRNGLSVAEEDLTFDTSIACDSCDVWYHAFCVGFNSECCTSESSWLCPRCVTDEAQRKSDGVPSQNFNSSVANGDTGWTTNPSFSSKVSVSVADAGETAVVVSMVEGQQEAEYFKTSISEVELVVSAVEEQQKPDHVNTSISEAELVVSAVQKAKHVRTSISEDELDLDCDANEETENFLSDTSSGNAKLDEQTENSGFAELRCNSLLLSDEKNSKTTALENEKNYEVPFGIPEVCLKEELLELPSLEETKSELSVSQADNAELQLSLTLSGAKGVSSPSCYSATDGDKKSDNTDGMMSKPSSSEEVEVSSAVSRDIPEAKNQISGSRSHIDFELGLPVTTSSVDELIGGDIKCQIPGSSKKPSLERNVSAGKTSVDSGEDIIDILPKHVELTVLVGESSEEKQPRVKDTGFLKNHTRKREMDTKYPAKKAKSDGKSQLLSSRRQANASGLDNSKICSRNAEHNNDDMLINALSKKARSLDIMSIVQEINHRPNDRPAGTYAGVKSTMRRENSSGLRVKKIMRRVGEREESSILVQKLSKEIREAVLDKTSSNNEKNDFDVKLLTAFREAIVKPRDELVNKNVPSCRSLKKSLLQKGKTRENLTKKIYGTSNGRRKRAWDRDWEIEFWKHRCKRSKPEKVETLHSVLALLKKATNTCSNDSTTDQGPEGERNSILSRVYLADTSVFPRKDDIKPLSFLAGSSQGVSECNVAKSPSGISRCSPQVKAVSSDNTVKRSSALNCIAEVSCGKQSSHSDSSGSKGRVQSSSKEITIQSDSSKIDKRKWALEVLARKNASINSSGSKRQEEDKSALKGNYPLLVQLPIDMRPVPAPSSHNKVPLSIRQAQLYRITEHYLRRTNLPTMRKTADTELAVADAVNIEKGIFERSNSKLVYINLCSQALSQQSDKLLSAETIAFNSSTPTVEVTNQVVEETSSGSSVGGWSKVEEALKLAGFISDSPPNSPFRPTINDLDVEDNPKGNTSNQVTGNVLDMDTRPELDIYGDFEYDLEDEGYEVSKLLEQRHKDSKLKVVLSTLGCDEPVNLQNSEPQHSGTKVVAKYQGNFKVRIEDNAENGIEKIMMDPSLLPIPSEGGMYDEPSLSEYEELYGPDNILFANKLPDELIGEKSESLNRVAVGESIIPHEIEKHQSRDGATVSEFENEGCAVNNFPGGRTSLNRGSSGGENSQSHSLAIEIVPIEQKERVTSNEFLDPDNSIFKKVEAYVKEHIRPLCKSGVITVDQYRWAVGKTTDKVMKFHHKAKNANFLIKEGEKVKKLAGQYVEAAQQKDS